MALMRGTVVLQPYDPLWADQFEEERALLQPIFGDHTVEHTGSTSVPGLAAKPIIDMLVGLDTLADFEQYRTPLEALGYVSMPDREKAWEIFIPKGPDDARTHYLHVLIKDSPEYENVLLFRDYLRAHDEARDAYGALKQELASRFAGDRKSYTAEKANFIVNIIAKARAARGV
jgi:GrpB-like predicted nucleotidyltransferase (UPF0157 family)